MTRLVIAMKRVCEKLLEQWDERLLTECFHRAETVPLAQSATSECAKSLCACAEQAGEWKIFLDVSSIKNTSQGAPGHQSPLVDHGG